MHFSNLWEISEFNLPEYFKKIAPACNQVKTHQLFRKNVEKNEYCRDGHRSLCQWLDKKAANVVSNHAMVSPMENVERVLKDVEELSMVSQSSMTKITTLRWGRCFGGVSLGKLSTWNALQKNGTGAFFHNV